MQTVLINGFHFKFIKDCRDERDTVVPQPDINDWTVVLNCFGILHRHENKRTDQKARVHRMFKHIIYGRDEHVNKTKEHNFTSIPRIRAISQTIIQSITHFDPASPTHCIENRMRELSLFFCSYASLQTRVLPAYSQEVHRFVTEQRRKVRYANCQESLRCRELPRCKSFSVHLGELPPSRLLPMHRKRGIRV